MKKLLLILLCLPMIGFGQEITNSLSTNNKDIFLISNNQASIFLVGNNVPKENRLDNFQVRKDTVLKDTEDDVYEQIIYYLQLDSEILLEIYPDYYNQDKIGEIIVISNKLKTKEGIGVGSIIEDFISKYNDVTLWYANISDMCVIETKKYHNMQFVLDSSDIEWESVNDRRTGVGDMTLLKISDFKPNSKIRLIRLLK